ncbi:hypothetical protein [Williamsia deligens]|uniref:YbaB/EbfC DNA-binding family protein n=1 Tax=Williamsia deligens TaxID=321325 RepID=A0ABW3GB62_9NOCA|nr:hypothetical protein [Williamsia deligens]MCP2195289.1 hypothetical protein [Williamsia deligens]
MAEQNAPESTDSEKTGSPARAPKAAVAAATRFVRRGGGAASAVIEPIGASGVRILMVAQDGGVIGDQVVADVATAHAVVDAVEGLTTAEWDRELSSVATPRPGHWKQMAGWVANT